MDKCSGVNCPVRNNCNRFSLTSSYLLQPPFTIKDGVFKCSLYWGEQQNSIMHQLEKIIGISKPDAYCDNYCRKSTECNKKDCKL